VDQATVRIYEEQADRWVERRAPRLIEDVRAFAARIDGPSVDLGCGPGWYAAELPAPAIALDAARAMLDVAQERAPLALRVQGDLEDLPFRRGGLGGAWASASYVHLSRAAIPSAFGDLHRALRPGGLAQLILFSGDADGGTFADDDFPGRLFSLWPEQRLRDVLVGAGFDIEGLELRNREKGRDAFWVAQLRRARTLADTVGADMRLLVCGLNPSLYSADVGIGYGRPGNRFWPAAIAAGLVSRPRDPRHALHAHGVGMTDCVKRATAAAAELSRDEYADGIARVERLCAWLQPRAVCFVGLAGWRAAVDRNATPGPVEDGFAGTPAYVMPSTSGLNARTSLDDLAAHLTQAHALSRK
jgi:TDG/mug DNA glycosylase family protein